MNKLFLLSGIVLAGLGVAIGAFGAHALKAHLQLTNRVETFETGVQYQFYHALALIIIGIIAEKLNNSSAIEYAGYSMIVGTIIFSFSLYAICLTGITKLGAITPIGGVLLIVGWVCFATAVIKKY